MTPKKPTAWNNHQPNKRILRSRYTQVCLIAIGAAAVLFNGCREEGVVPTVDCQMVTAGVYSQLTVWPLCTSCHGSSVKGGARHDAPGGIDYDTYESAKAHAISGAAQVNSGLMPPGGSPQPTAEQKTALFNWALCGTPN